MESGGINAEMLLSHLCLRLRFVSSKKANIKKSMLYNKQFSF